MLRSDTLVAPPPVLRLARRPMKAKLPKRVISAAKINLNKFWEHLDSFEANNNNNEDCAMKASEKEEEMSRYSVYLWEQMKKVAELQRIQKELSQEKEEKKDKQH